MISLATDFVIPFDAYLSATLVAADLAAALAAVLPAIFPALPPPGMAFRASKPTFDTTLPKFPSPIPSTTLRASLITGASLLPSS